MAIDLTELKPWATHRDKEYIEAIVKHGGYRPAAKALKVSHQVISRAMRNLKKRAAAKGFAPDYDLKHPSPDPFIVRGYSTLYKHPDTNAPLQWVKTRLDDQQYQALLKEAIATFIESTPQLPAPAPPTAYNTDIIPWLQIGDAHLGMLAHAAETNDNFDLRIAEQELCAAIAILIDELQPTERLVINDLGDFTHYENYTATTEASGHQLDFDSRFPKMIKTYSRVMRFIIEKCLTKALNVDVIINQGNHSRTNDIWMAELLRVAFGHTGRVNVLNNDNVFIPYRMGNTLVMTHHSDKCKPNRLAQVMITDFRKDYGETEHHYIDIGHIHHGMVMKEYPSIYIESFNTLAASDKWAHDGGYRSRKSITIIYRSKQYGEVGRRTLALQEIRSKMTGGIKQQPEKQVFSV